MRTPRRAVILKNRTQFFHVISRVVDRRKIFGDEEKQVFLRMVRRQESFSGVKVLAYSLMGNHFHLLIEVPVRPVEISDDEIWERMKLLHSREKIEEFEQELQYHKSQGHGDWVSEFFERQFARMYDLSEFVKEIKQRFSIWFNQRNERKGTLWEERFKSVLIEGQTGALMRVAAYIELNALRAGLVEKFDDYPWCSANEALNGGLKSREGICSLASGQGPILDWPSAISKYLAQINHKASTASPSTAEGRGGQTGESVNQDPASGAVIHDRARQRTMTEGLIIGSYGFIEEIYTRNRKYLCNNRKKLCHRLTGEDLSGLHTYRGVK